MEVKRLVTAHGSDGNSIFASIGPAPRANWSRYHPGAGITVVWADPAGATIPNTGQDITETLPSLVPPVGATSLVFVQFPAETGVTDPGFDPVAAQEEFVRLNPGIAQLMDPESPGMHATDTIDYVIVLEGEIWATLDGGREELLRQHDVIIQNGTRHAWRNRSPRPAKLACFSVGARRRQSTDSVSPVFCGANDDHPV